MWVVEGREGRVDRRPGLTDGCLGRQGDRGTAGEEGQTETRQWGEVRAAAVPDATKQHRADCHSCITYFGRSSGSRLDLVCRLGAAAQPCLLLSSGGPAVQNRLP